MKSFGRALHLYGLISCGLAVHCSKNHHREQAKIDYGFLSKYFSL